MSEKLLKLKDITEMLQVSRATIYRWIEHNQFPKYIKIGGGSYWLEKDILDYIQSQKTA